MTDKETYAVTNGRGLCIAFLPYNPLDKVEQLEQENAVLKAYKDVNEDFKTAWEELKAENKRLRQEWRLDCLKCEYKNTKADVDKYRQTLQEIRDIAMGIMDDDIEESSAYSDARQIINLITKAEEE